MSIVGLDYGMKRTGIAISSSDNSFAMPYDTVATSDVVATLCSMRTQENIELVVMGLPLSIKGHENPMTALVYSFAELLKKEGFAVKFVDERHSTNKAVSSMHSAGLKGKKKKEKKDEVAACIILQDALDFDLISKD
jgi:putative Holliday junction resolvase